MRELNRPNARPKPGFNDPRSTGSGPPRPVRDILALRGTIKIRS